MSHSYNGQFYSTQDFNETAKGNGGDRAKLIFHVLDKDGPVILTTFGYKDGREQFAGARWPDGEKAQAGLDLLNRKMQQMFGVGKTLQTIGYIQPQKPKTESEPTPEEIRIEERLNHLQQEWVRVNEGPKDIDWNHQGVDPTSPLYGTQYPTKDMAVKSLEADKSRGDATSPAPAPTLKFDQ